MLVKLLLEKPVMFHAGALNAAPFGAHCISTRLYVCSVRYPFSSPCHVQLGQVPAGEKDTSPVRNSINITPSKTRVSCMGF